MTIKELKIILDKFPEDTLVMARGYEGGFCDAREPKEVIEMNLNVHDEWYYGPHELVRDIRVYGDKDYEKVNAIII